MIESDDDAAGKKSNTMNPHRGVLARAIHAVFQRQAGIAVVALVLAGAASSAAAQPTADPRAVATANLAYASFGSVEIGVDAPTITPNVSDLFKRTAREHEAYSECTDDPADDPACAPEVRRWRESIERLDGLAGLELLTAVNAAVNEMIAYRDDRATYGKADYWATPMESLTGYGDCEDYAIVKYLSLYELGISHDRMRIVVVKDNKRDIGHAVLVVTLESGAFVLDNVLTRPTPDRELAHYQPIYSFNTNQQWLNVSVRLRSDQVAASDVDRKPVGVIPPAASNKAAAMLQMDRSVE
jgi:predicted transglutaminase-like cysteine proteinase